MKAVILALMVTAALAACSKKDETPVAPAVVVVPQATPAADPVVVTPAASAPAASDTSTTVAK